MNKFLNSLDVKICKQFNKVRLLPITFFTSCFVIHTNVLFLLRLTDIHFKNTEKKEIFSKNYSG